MNKILLIVQREVLNRVQKKSFLIATILIPLIFPAIIGLLVYVKIQEEKTAKKEVIYYIDESNIFRPDSSKFIFKEFNGTLDEAKTVYKASDDFGVLFIPKFEISDPKGIILFTKVTPSPEDKGAIEGIFATRIKDLKMQRMNIDQKLLDSLKTEVSIDTKNLGDDGKEESSNSVILLFVGMAGGILMYMFIFIYGAQIMQGIIEEKTSKVVEVIVSSVKPFQLMMGKIVGLATVGLLQFVIWIILMVTVTTVLLGQLGIDPPQKQAMEQVVKASGASEPVANAGPSEASLTYGQVLDLPWGYIGFCFVFYFLGGYLLYGALFAAVGSAVDSPAEAQQFMFPITIPLLISYMSLFFFIIGDPHGTISVWLSIIPFTSPIAMMGRIGYGVPFWQLALSMLLLIGGFILTTWAAGRIYRVGILMHGTKINYKVMAKWFMQKG